MMSETKYEDKWIRVVQRNDWVFVERKNVTGIVGIVAVTNEGNIVLIKQYREPFQKTVVEIPAGLVGDEDSGETIETAARRELLEETGYYAHQLEVLGTFPVSPGLSTEQLTYVVATDLEKQTDIVGVDNEQIEVFELPVPLAAMKLMEMNKQDDILIDAKLFASLMFAYPVIAIRAQEAAQVPSRLPNLDNLGT